MLFRNTPQNDQFIYLVRLSIPMYEYKNSLFYVIFISYPDSQDKMVKQPIFNIFGKLKLIARNKKQQSPTGAYPWLQEGETKNQSTTQRTQKLVYLKNF